MKKVLILLAVAAAAFGCAPKQEQKVMARFVPERYDDFIFENNLIAGRLYGEALESCGKGQITSPGVDVWVKTPGALVANQRYIDELQNGKSYHINWGNGKDCYKVGKSLGAGASAVVVNGELQLPATNFRSWEIKEEGPEKVVFVLNYPEWQAEGAKVSLSKQITVVADSYFCRVDDIYTVTEGPDSLEIVAGVNRHVAQSTIESELALADRYAVWEQASDQSVEPEDGMLGVAVYVPGAEFTCIAADENHGLVGKKVKSGEAFTYYFGSCWSKGDLKTAEDWFNVVKSQE